MLEEIVSSCLLVLFLRLKNVLQTQSLLPSPTCWVFITFNQFLSEANIQLYTPGELCQYKQNIDLSGKLRGSEPHYNCNDWWDVIFVYSLSQGSRKTRVWLRSITLTRLTPVLKRVRRRKKEQCWQDWRPRSGTRDPSLIAEEANRYRRLPPKEVDCLGCASPRQWRKSWFLEVGEGGPGFIVKAACDESCFPRSRGRQGPLEFRRIWSGPCWWGEGWSSQYLLGSRAGETHWGAPPIQL